MITLPFRFLRTPFPELAPRSGSFDRPIACYARHRDDAEFVLPVASVFDFQKASVIWFDPFSDSNRAALAEVPGNPFGIGKDRAFDPHWFVRLHDGSYLMFFQRRRYFYRFRPEAGEFDALFPEDLWLPPEVDEFWATNYLHPDGSVTFLVHETYANRNRYSIYRSDAAFAEFRLIHSWHTKSGNIPHVIVPYADGYLLSDFYYNEFRFANDARRRRLSEEEVLRAAYSPLFAEFKRWRPDAELGKFLKHSPKWLVPVDDFREFVRTKFVTGGFKSVKEYCDTTPYAFVPFPGEITYVSPSTREERVFETTCSNPAHFEVDGESGDVYVSSHNFNYLNRTVLEYFWPAAIDRFVPDPESFLKKSETFSVPDGFRFTSHRVVESDGGRFVATFGQPNRFFSIPAPSLRGHSAYDVGPNAISEFSHDSAAMLKYLRRGGGEENVTVKAVEACTDGSGLVFAVSGTEALVLSVGEEGADLKERMGIPFPDDSMGNPGSEVFRCRTTHLNFVT